MNYVRIIKSVLLLVCCILFFSACRMHSPDLEEAISASTDIADSSELMSMIESLNFPTDVKKYHEEEFIYDNIPDDLVQAYASSISPQELEIVKSAWTDAPSKALRGVDAHIYVLLRGLQNTGNTDIEITSATFVPYDIRDAFSSIEQNCGCDLYALQITDDVGNTYLVWDGVGYEEVTCNGEKIHSWAHILF